MSDFNTLAKKNFSFLAMVNRKKKKSKRKKVLIPAKAPNYQLKNPYDAGDDVEEDENFTTVETKVA